MATVSASTALDSAYSSALGSAVAEAGGSDLDKQAFLMLLVTQFQYQDPLNPMEDKEFVAQLAQFSSLEQSMETNANLTSLIAIQEQSAVIGASNYIGREVSARGYGVSVSEKGEKISTVQFASDVAMASCYVSILDTSTNTVLNTYNLGKRAAGTIHEFEWDGKLSTGGTASDGVYTISITGKNENGESVMVDTSVSGLVNAVSHYNGELYLRLDDGRTVLLSNVREVVTSSTASTGKTETTTGNNTENNTENETENKTQNGAGDDDDAADANP